MLTHAGHDASTVAQQAMGGRPDPDIADVFRAEDRAVVTLDLDFADIRTYPPADYMGIIVLRMFRQDKDSVLSAAASLLPLLEHEPFTGMPWIVDEMRVRIRG